MSSSNKRTDRTARVKRMRAYSAKLLRFAKSQGSWRYDEMQKLALAEEKAHRSSVKGKYQVGTNTCVLYHMLKAICWAMRLREEAYKSEEGPLIPLNALDVRSDYLMALAIVSRHGQAFHDAGFTYAALTEVCELVSYHEDLAV